jgi:hypothetical protein
MAQITEIAAMFMPPVCAFYAKPKTTVPSSPGRACAAHLLSPEELDE